MAMAPEMVAIAVELIAEFGVAVPFSRKAGGTYAPGTGQSTGSAPLTMSPKCLTENKGLWLGKELGVMGEKKLTVAASGLTFVPQPGDKFTHGGKTYMVMDKGVITTELEGTAIIHEVYGVIGGG
jgi:hypothetical protein